MNRTIRLRRDTASRWLTANPVLADGEPGYEKDTGRLKIGDGSARWADLPYYVSLSDMVDRTDEAILAHINSSNPHPVYDDGPSLFLIYENAKV